MKLTAEQYIESDYSFEFSNEIMSYRMFDKSDLKLNLGEQPQSLALVSFDQESIPCLIESDLQYRPEQSDEDARIYGSVLAKIPDAWRYTPKLTERDVIITLESFMKDPEEPLHDYQFTAYSHHIELYSTHHADVGTIGIELRGPDMVQLTLDMPLGGFRTDSELYDHVVEIVKAWGSLHAFIVFDATLSSAVPNYRKKNSPQHRILIGQTSSQEFHPLGFTIDTAIRDYNALDPDIPAPHVGNLNFSLLNKAIAPMSEIEVTKAIRRAILVKRTGFITNGEMDPFETSDLHAAIYMQRFS